MYSLNRRAWVDIDLGALSRNAAAAAAHAGVPLLPMVKADAYGLGAIAVARTLERLEPWGYGVATIPEGEELRHAAIARPIVVFTPLLLGDFDAAVRANLTPTLGSRQAIERWKQTGLPWHLAVDTGMSRAGIQWNEVDSILDLLAPEPPQGVFTHFHSAELRDGSRAEQEGRFEAVLAKLPVRPLMVHAENSPALEHGERSRWSVVRPGIFLYGVGSGTDPRVVPEPVVSVRGRIIDLRTIEPGESVSYGATYHVTSRRRIATVGVGYADGYRRALGNRASALLHGRRVPVVGVVTMDMTMLDVSNVQCEIGDIVTLIGRDGDDAIGVSELAAVGDISPYELLTGLRARLPRRYIESEP